MRNSLIDLKNAFSRYRSGKAGHPKFASRRHGQSFTVDSSNGKVLLSAGKTIKIPKLGTFRLYEALECGYVDQTFTISKEGSRWFISFCVDAEPLPVQHLKSSVTVDVGIKSFVMLSNQQVFDEPKPLIASAKTKLATWQCQASRQVKGSNKGRKTYNKISRIHAQIPCIDKDILHKLTTYLSLDFQFNQDWRLECLGHDGKSQAGGGDIGT